MLQRKDIFFFVLDRYLHHPAISNYVAQIFKFMNKIELFLIYGEIRKLACNSFRPTFWAKTHANSFAAVAEHISVTSCNLQFIKHLL